MNPALKIKAVSLAAEITLIRREERKWLKSRRWLAKATGNTLPADANIQKARAEANFWGLRTHRLALRPEARVAHIAYGFVRGRTYAEIERTGSSIPDWSKVIRLVKTYGEGYQDQDVKALVAAWSK